MLSYSDIKPKKYIVLSGEPYEVLSSNVFRKQKRKPVNQTKLKHLISGKVTDHSFHQSDTVEEADVSKSQIKYLFKKQVRGGDTEFWFSSPNDPSDRFTLSYQLIGESAKFLKENSVVETRMFNEEIIGVSVPIKVTLKVSETPPGVRGNTSQGGTKQATLETGAVVQVPLFVNEGENIEVNTETGEYSGRS